MFEHFLEKNRRNHPLAHAVGESLGRYVGEKMNARRAENDRRLNLQRFRLSHLSPPDQFVTLLRLARDEGLLKMLQHDPRLAAIGWEPGEYVLSGGYVYVRPTMDAADLANEIVTARNYKDVDDAVRNKAATFAAALANNDLHPALREIDLGSCWRGLGHHADAASLNRLQLPEGALRLNALFYPSLWLIPLGVDANGEMQEQITVDDYPGHAYDMLFQSIAHVQHLDHPTLGVAGSQPQARRPAACCLCKARVRVGPFCALAHAFERSQRTVSWLSDRCAEQHTRTLSHSPSRWRHL